MTWVPNSIFDANPSNVARLRVLGLEQGAVTSTFEVTELRSDLLTPYEQSNAEVTNQDPVVVSGVSYPVMDVTPNVSIKNTDNTATGPVLKLSNQRGSTNAGANNDVAGEIRFLNNDSAIIINHLVILKSQQVM